MELPPKPPETEQSLEELIEFQRQTIEALTKALAHEHELRVKAEQLDRYDRLVTSLLHQGEAMNVIERRVEMGEPFGIFHIDIDHFKDVNDVLGHPAGDALLIAFGLKLCEIFKRSTDEISTTPGRMGGDEFVVFIDLKPGGGRRIEDIERQMDNAYEAIKAIGEDLKEQYPQMAELGLGFSVGGAWFSPDNPVDAMTLYGQADEAMHEEKPKDSR